MLRVGHVSKVFGRSRWFNPSKRAFTDPREEVLDLIELPDAKQSLLEKPRKVNMALREVSFEVNKGEVFVIMGLSGCGKSTMLRCINRLIAPTRGTIEFEGQDVTRMTTKELRSLRQDKISMVFQHFALFPNRNLLDNVAFGLEVQGAIKASRHAKARQMLKTVGLGNRASANPDELSGGMKQRVGLARALVNEPKLLLMDEPFSALDPMIRTSLQEEVLEIQENMGLTIIMVTHDLDEALSMGDRIAILSTPDSPGGNVMQIGTPSEIILHPKNEYVAEFVRDVNRAKVLRVRDIMFPSDDKDALEQSEAHPLKLKQHLSDVMHHFLLDGQPHPVENKSGELVGWLTAEALNEAINMHAGGVGDGEE